MIAGPVPEFLALPGVPSCYFLEISRNAKDLCDIVGSTEWTYRRTTVRELRDSIDHIVEIVVVIARAHRHNG
jgi:hypothetical protein